MPNAKISWFSNLEHEVRGGDRPHSSDLPEFSFSLRVNVVWQSGRSKFPKALIRALNSSSAAKISATGGGDRAANGLVKRALDKLLTA